MKTRNISIAAALAAAMLILLSGCTKKAEARREIGVFVPGMVAGSPTYEMMVNGVERALAERDGYTAVIVEGGFNQGEWKDKVLAMAASNHYLCIVTTNPAMPQICSEVNASVPGQKFLILDGFLEGNPDIFTFRFNQMEQAYLAGYFAGLVTESGMKGTNAAKKVGFLAGQEYPDMNKAIRPGFEYGLDAAVGAGELDFRVLGNWYDAPKAAELAGNMYDRGADVILTIAGGGNQGVIQAAKERGTYVVWFDSPDYALAPGTILGCTTVALDKAAYENVLKAVDGKLPWGSAEVVGVKGGWVGFADEAKEYLDSVDPAIQAEMKQKLEEFRSGAFAVTMPVF